MDLDLVGLLSAIVEALDPARDVAATARGLEELLASRLALEEAHVLVAEPGGELKGVEARVPRDIPFVERVRASGRRLKTTMWAVTFTMLALLAGAVAVSLFQSPSSDPGLAARGFESSAQSITACPRSTMPAASRSGATRLNA